MSDADIKEWSWDKIELFSGALAREEARQARDLLDLLLCSHPEQHAAYMTLAEQLEKRAGFEQPVDEDTLKENRLAVKAALASVGPGR